MECALRWLPTWPVFLIVLASADAAHATDPLLVPEPAHARMRLSGPSPVHSHGSLDVSNLSEGSYSLVASAPGHTTVRAVLLRQSDGSTRFRPWAGASALLAPPGFAHLRRAEPRGWLHFGGWALSGTAWLLSHSELGDARDRLDRAALELDRSSGAEQTRAAQLEWAAAREEEFDLSNVSSLWASFAVAAWIGGGVEAWLLTRAPAVSSPGDGSTRIHLPPASRWKAALSSLVVPGSGQRSVGRERRGNLFSSAIMLTAAGAIVAQDAYLDARRERSHAIRLVELTDGGPDAGAAIAALRDAEDQTDRRSTVRYAVLGSAIALYAWNVIDALVVPEPGASSSDAGLGIGIVPDREGVRLAWTWGFD